MEDQDIKEKCTTTELAVAEKLAGFLGLTVEDVIVSSQLGVTPAAFLDQKQSDKAIQKNTK